MLERLKQIRQFIEVDIWRIRLVSLSRGKRFYIRFTRIWIIAIKEFINDKCAEKASALTYLSMLSLVPVLAMIFGVARVFGIRELMEKELERYFSGQTEILNKVQPFVDKVLDTQSGGVVAGISAVFLIYTVVRLLINIESAFNDMWDIKKSRRWERKISDYVAVILLGPVLLIVASSATVFVKDTIQEFVTNIEFLGQLRSGIFFLLKLLPYTILWFLLFGIYLIFPNTHVKFWPALFAGIVAGTLYQLNQQAFISLQFAFARYNAIYGSIAFLPLFLIWLQISWLIVLFGAEVCYGAQYSNKWEMNSEVLKISYNHRRKLAILMLYRIVKKFEKGDGGMSLDSLATSVNVPRKYVTEICYELEKATLITRIDSDKVSYYPSFDIHQMDIYTVLELFEKEGMGDFDSRKSHTFQNIEHALGSIKDHWKDTSLNKLVKDL